VTRRPRTGKTTPLPVKPPQARARALPSRTRQGAARSGPGVQKTPAPPPPPAAMGLHTADGARKYLTAGERDAFLRAAEEADRQVRTLSA
jgi:hypothetical protein